MNFTCFLNSRGRPQQLIKCIEALEKNTFHQGAVEIIITVDNDDLDSIEVVSNLNARKTFLFNPIIGERPANLCASYNNMARKARGQYLLVLNDDAEMDTRYWDAIALEKIVDFKTSKNAKDDIIYIKTSDTSVDKPAGTDYSSFPIISKEAVNILGFFMYESYVGLGGDSSIAKLYEQTDRVINAPEIKINHVFHDTLMKVVSPDITAYEMRANSQKHSVDPFKHDVSQDVEKLKNYIFDRNR